MPSRAAKRNARLFSVRANAAHGLRRSNDDKRKAVQTLLSDPEWCQWSDREIARRCAVDHKTVGNLRAASASEEIPQIAEESGAARTVQRSGRTYQQDTSGVSESNKQRKKGGKKKPAKPAETAGPSEVESLREQLAEALDNAEEMRVQSHALPANPGSRRQRSWARTVMARRTQGVCGGALAARLQSQKCM